MVRGGNKSKLLKQKDWSPPNSQEPDIHWGMTGEHSSIFTPVFVVNTQTPSGRNCPWCNRPQSKQYYPDLMGWVMFLSELWCSNSSGLAADYLFCSSGSEHSRERWKWHFVGFSISLAFSPPRQPQSISGHTAFAYSLVGLCYGIVMPIKKKNIVSRWPLFW